MCSHLLSHHKAMVLHSAYRTCQWCRPEALSKDSSLSKHLLFPIPDLDNCCKPNSSMTLEAAQYRTEAAQSQCSCRLQDKCWEVCPNNLATAILMPLFPHWD